MTTEIIELRRLQTSNKPVKLIPVEQWTPTNTQQRDQANLHNAIYVMQFRYTMNLPWWLISELEYRNLRAVLIGYTTRKSTTWAIVERETIRDNGEIREV